MSTDRGDKPLARDSFSKLITQIESLTKILESNETKPVTTRGRKKGGDEKNMQNVWSIPQETRVFLGARENAKNGPTG